MKRQLSRVDPDKVLSQYGSLLAWHIPNVRRDYGQIPGVATYAKEGLDYFQTVAKTCWVIFLGQHYFGFVL